MSPRSFYSRPRLGIKKTRLHIAQVMFYKLRQFPVRWIFHPDQLLFLLTAKNAGTYSYFRPALIVLVKKYSLDIFGPFMATHFLVPLKFN